mmetsp:Transcript_53867/g.89619  ORF Transcript_53867/g.89619 Transcript_53867/m.89619 type:complete len:260 (+) Transcript_53867:3143-3922(+)
MHRACTLWPPCALTPSSPCLGLQLRLFCVCVCVCVQGFSISGTSFRLSVAVLGCCSGTHVGPDSCFACSCVSQHVLRTVVPPFGNFGWAYAPVPADPHVNVVHAFAMNPLALWRVSLSCRTEVKTVSRLPINCTMIMAAPQHGGAHSSPYSVVQHFDAYCFEAVSEPSSAYLLYRGKTQRQDFCGPYIYGSVCSTQGFFHWECQVTTLLHSIQTGDKLKPPPELAHGTFLAWLSDHCAGFVQGFLPLPLASTRLTLCPS